MAERFDWETNGLDRARFEALTKLLRLRYHGQVGVPTRFDEPHLYAPDDGDIALDDADSTKLSTLVHFGSSRLQRAFLDRLAELVANEKGGRHVSAASMTNSQDEVRVFVARNSKLRPRDEAFVRRTEALLRRVAEDQALILEHYEARIHDYICDLRQVLKRYMQGEQRESPSRLVAALRELYDAAFAQYVSNTGKNEALVAQAHQLCKTFSEDDFNELWPSGSRNPRASLVRTRGSHGKLYNLWGLPDFQGLSMAQMEQIIRPVRDLESSLSAEIINRDGVVVPQAKESTLGAATISTVLPGSNTPSTTSMVSSYLQNQRANLLVKASSAKGASYSDDETEIEQPTTEVVAASGPCGGFDCKKTTTGRCSHCSGAWFCSVSCEDEAADRHLFACNRRPLTTADLLRRDCLHHYHPEYPQVREDYGFQRYRNRGEESKLMGLYVGIFNYQSVPSQEVDSWMTQGILADKVIELFSALPERCRGGYYTWFLQHRYILDDSKELARDEGNVHNYIQELFREARVYLDPADQAKPIEHLTPWAKQNCFLFFAFLLDSARLSLVMRNLDLWFDFGYVVCSDAYEENNLSNLYQRLLFGNKIAQEHFRSLGMEHLAPRDIPARKFEEFWTAWEKGSLMALFERYEGSQVADSSALAEFLAYPGGSPRPSVWRLRHFLAIEDANVLTTTPEIAGAAIEYGFQPDLDVRTRMSLHQFYLGLFRRGVPPSIVHEAKKMGALDKVAEWSPTDTDVDERVKQVLSSLSCDSGFEGLQSSGSSEGKTKGWWCMVM
ncbi:hypothetical protein OQA88_9678 [Cercophora sp. LCS_1]